MTTATQKLIELTGSDLKLQEVINVCYQFDYEVRLAPSAYKMIEHSRKVIDDTVASGKVVYGVNTGFGAMSNVCISAEDLDQLQLNLVRSHASGAGWHIDENTVRAMMILRANTLAKGYSGVRPIVIEALLNILNAGIIPVLPCQGSLGASGDLAPLAHMALVLIGEGEAFYKGERLSGKDALNAAGLKPVTLKAKEGLALLNGTQYMNALGARNYILGNKYSKMAAIAAAMSIEAMMASHHPFDERIGMLRPHPGHIKTAEAFRRLLAHSEINHAHENCNKVQDAYSMRCIPQVHGAVLETVEYVQKVMETEINSVTDNPLVFPDGSIISQGNFHGEPLAMAMDYLSIASCELASMSERRMDKLMNPVFSGLPAFLVPEGYEGLNSGMMIAHYTAASIVSENKTLAFPASVDSIPTSNDKEDHVSMGAWATRKNRQILTNVRTVLSCELLAAAQGLEFRKGLKAGAGVQAAYEKIREVVAPLKEDRSLSADIAAIERQFDTGEIMHAVENAVGPLW